MIPTSFDLARYHFLKHGHFRIFLNLRERFTAGIAVHIFCVFYLHARIKWFPGNNVWKSEKPLSPTKMSREWRENGKITIEKWPQNLNYSTNFNDLGLILFEDNVLCNEKNATFSNIKVTKIERSAFWDTRYRSRCNHDSAHNFIPVPVLTFVGTIVYYISCKGMCSHWNWNSTVVIHVYPSVRFSQQKLSLLTPSYVFMTFHMRFTDINSWWCLTEYIH